MYVIINNIFYIQFTILLFVEVLIWLFNEINEIILTVGFYYTLIQAYMTTCLISAV